MRRKKFHRKTTFRYVVPDPSDPLNKQINGSVPAERYAIIYMYGYVSAYGKANRDMFSAHAQAPELAKEFVRKIFTEGVQDGLADLSAGTPPPQTFTIKDFLEG